jgi:hypothetical protein
MVTEQDGKNDLPLFGTPISFAIGVIKGLLKKRATSGQSDAKVEGFIFREGSA